MILPKDTIKRIVVNRHKIAANKKKLNGKNHPLMDAVFTVQTSKGPIPAKWIKVHGRSRLVYEPTRPLKCGATVWIETTSKVELF